MLRPLLLLQGANPGVDLEALMQLTLGDRERLLLTVRQAQRNGGIWRRAGDGLPLIGQCPHCGERVEVELDADEMIASASAPAAAEAPHRLEHAGAIVEFRLPNSADLVAAGGSGDVERARRVLLDRCVTRVEGAFEGALGSELPVAVQEALEQAMDHHDPLAVVQVNLSCPACAAHWQPRVDVSSLVWSEMAIAAQQLLREVATLARAFHWSERSILNMSARRRHLYLELAGA